MELGDMRVAMHTVVQAVKDAVSAIASLASRVAHAGMRVLLKGLGFGGQHQPASHPKPDSYGRARRCSELFLPPRSDKGLQTAATSLIGRSHRSQGHSQGHSQGRSDHRQGGADD